MTVTAEYLKTHFDELIPAAAGQEIEVERESEDTFRLKLVSVNEPIAINKLWGIAKGKLWIADDFDSREVNKEIEDSFYGSEPSLLVRPGYLLDTQVLLWSMKGERGRLSAASAAIVRSERRLTVSIASLWEIAIKASKGKLTLPGETLPAFLTLVDQSQLRLLPVEAKHLLELEKLPYLHKDPFDRLIVAQARAEGM